MDSFPVPDFVTFPGISSVNECPHSAEPGTHFCQRCHSVFVFLLTVCLQPFGGSLYQRGGVFRVLKAAPAPC